MGLGGNLIWTAVLRGIAEHDGRPAVVCHRPQPSDLLMGRLHDRTRSLADDPIFRANPRLRFTEAREKSPLINAFDRMAMLPFKLPLLRRAYETAIARLAAARTHRGAPRLVHVDMVIHSYADRQLSNRFVWKSGGHAAEVIARGFSVDLLDTRGELHFDESEMLAVRQIRRHHQFDGPYIALEPGTNQDWFGDLRAWPLERWHDLVVTLRRAHPDIAVVQIGVAESPALDNVIDLRGATTFRQAALLIRDSATFVGTESGLMHAAAAVAGPAVILWGGVTLPEFAGYPRHQTTICKYVSCAPCGHLGWCDRAHQCMRTITVDEVASAVDSTIAGQKQREASHG